MRITIKIQNIFPYVFVKVALINVIFLLILIFTCTLNVNGLKSKDNFLIENAFILTNKLYLLVILANVIIALFISYLINYVKANLKVFITSPFERFTSYISYNLAKNLIKIGLKKFLSKRR